MVVGARRRQVHHHAAGPHVGAEMARPGQRAGHDPSRQPERAVIGDRQRLVIAARADDAGHRRKHLFAVDPHVIARAPQNTAGAM